MNKLYNTILEMSQYLASSKIKFVLTRFDASSKFIPNDLDILVRYSSFNQAVETLKRNGFTASSHDEALGGRIKGMQMNLVKSGMIKIDLHKDFTWRRSRYLNLNSIWNNLETDTIANVKLNVPREDIDAFIVVINIIFEKTYIKKDDFQYIKSSIDKIARNPKFLGQAKKYGWGKTFDLFIKWFESISRPNKKPVFVPLYLVVYSYWEKFIKEGKIDVISLLYYCFFRTRALLKGTLPYD